MSVHSSPLIERFPRQQEIFNYITNHPSSEMVNSPVANLAAPNSMEKVAQYFADKQMPRDKIKENVVEALKDEKVEKRWVEAKAYLEGIINFATNELQNVPDLNNEVTELNQLSTEIIYQEMQIMDTHSKIITELYDNILRDCLDKATYHSSSDGRSWVRHVP